MRLHPSLPSACLPSVVEHCASRKQRARGMGQSVELSRVTTPVLMLGRLRAREMRTRRFPGVRARRRFGRDFDFPFQPPKILNQDILTTLGWDSMRTTPTM